MTATLAEQLDTANAHMARVRAEYRRTKAEHAGEPRARAPRDRGKPQRPAKGQCVHGHKLTPANTYTHVNTAGQSRRRCKQCSRERDAARYAAKKAADRA